MTEALSPTTHPREFFDDLDWSSDVPRSLLYPLYRREYGHEFSEEGYDFSADPVAQRSGRDFVHRLLGDREARVFYIEEKARRFSSEGTPFHSDVLVEIQHVGAIEAKGWLYRLHTRSPRTTLAYVRFWNGVPVNIDLIDSIILKRVAAWSEYAGREEFDACGCVADQREGSAATRCESCGSRWSHTIRGPARWATRNLPIVRGDLSRAGAFAVGTTQLTFSDFRRLGGDP